MQGEKQAEAITDRYSKWSDTLSKVASTQQLTPEGVLAYVGNRVVQNHPTAAISLSSPAKTGR